MATARPLAAGELNQRIDLLSRSVTEDARGQVVEGWTPIGAVCAQARPVRAREVFRDGAVQALGSVIFSVRYRRGLTAADAVRWKGEVYELLGPPVDVDGGRHTLELITGTKPE